jgi:hypothetical protein
MMAHRENTILVKTSFCCLLQQIVAILENLEIQEESGTKVFHFLNRVLYKLSSRINSFIQHTLLIRNIRLQSPSFIVQGHRHIRQKQLF